MAASLEVGAIRALGAAFGPGGSAVSSAAPGRCTLVGEHVDYAGGLVLCTAIDLHVAAAVRHAPGGADRAVVDGERSDRGATPLRPAGGGYIFAAAMALRAAGVGVPPFEAATAASLPPGAGLASSAAVVCAVIAALLRLARTSLPASTAIDIAYHAEHDLLGVPSGRLDQHAVVESPEHGALLLDSATDRASIVPWPWQDAVLCLCDTGERHRVAGPEYALRREQTAAALRRAGVAGAQDVELDAVAGGRSGWDGDDVLDRRLRHVASESRRAADAAAALRDADLDRLGRLMSESHRSLRDDHEVSTPALDAVVAAALDVPGCRGARMVGAGFGGSVVALADAAGALACSEAMRRAAPPAARSWTLRPAAGLAFTARDAVASDI